MKLIRIRMKMRLKNQILSSKREKQDNLCKVFEYLILNLIIKYS